MRGRRPSRHWLLQDAKARFSELVRRVRSEGPQQAMQHLWPYGCRDGSVIGHRAICVTNCGRLLETIGWQHAEPVLRSLAYALLDRSGAKENPAQADLPADRPFRQNLESVKSIRDGWLDGKSQAEADERALAQLKQADATAKQKIVYRYFSYGADSK